MKTFSNFFGIIAILLLATGLVGIFTGEALNLIIASLATGSVAVFIFIYTSNIKSIQ